MTLDWLIIGGGLHGVHVAARLIGEAQVAADRVRIIDPAPELLSRWRACTSATGMTHLRSPSVHNLDVNPQDLQRHAGSRRHRKPGTFAAPYQRPSLALFDAHCDKVLEQYGLRALHVRDRAEACTIHCDSVQVSTTSGASFEAAHVVLACGASEQPRWPSWAAPGAPRVHHLFDPASPIPAERPPERVAVIGGGISAAQVALRLTSEGHTVHLVSRHELREHQFDSDPGWLGPKYMAAFRRERDMGRRRTIINQARHKGSVPRDLMRKLQGATRRGQLTVHQTEVHTADHDEATVTLQLSDETPLTVDRIVLATGFAPHRPGGRLVDGLIEAEALPCADCGYPIVDTKLRWHPRIYVTGPLAELELGPSARNIAGARRAGDRLVAACQSAAKGRSSHAPDPRP